MLLAKLLRLLVACALALFALSANARAMDDLQDQNTLLEKIELLPLDAPRAWLAQAVDSPEENTCFYDDGVSGPTHYNYFRSYQASQGRYSQSDPIGLAGGLNRFGYVDANPLSNIDPEGLRGNGPPARGAYYPRGSVPQPPTMPRPDNSSQAAGYFNPDGTWTCLKWNCPGNPESCGRNDLKLSTDFIPAQSNPMSPPSGCTCAGGPNWNRDFGLPRPFGPGVIDAARDLADLYNTLRPILKPR